MGRLFIKNWEPCPCEFRRDAPANSFKGLFDCGVAPATTTASQRCRALLAKSCQRRRRIGKACTELRVDARRTQVDCRLL